MAKTDKTIKINNKKIELSNTSKEFFPGAGLSKEDVVQYYQKMWKYAADYIADRPMVLQRFPDGVKGKGFYQKQTPDYFPKWISTIKVKNKKDNAKDDLVNCKNKQTLVYLANQGIFTMHVWLSKKHNLKKPDRAVFDFDPSDDDFRKVRKAAKAIKKLTDKHKIPLYVMTTGSKGLHAIIPLKPQKKFETIRKISRNIAQQMVDKNPDIFTLETTKKKRGNKVFIDYLRNSYAQTTVMPFSIRARKGAPVAVPLSWDEVGKKSLNPQKYTVKNVFRRVKRKKDPWKDLHKSAIDFKTFSKLKKD